MLCSKCNKDFNTLYTAQGLCSECADVMPDKINKSKEQRIKDICSKVLERIKPSIDEQISNHIRIELFLSSLREAIGNEATIELAGSMAKNTNLR